jgi:NDP-sugar pyrophosphorylase family protein
MFSPDSYLDLGHTDHRALFDNVTNVWEALKQIASYLQFRLKPAIEGRTVGKPFISNMVFVGRGTVVEHGAMIKGPAWIGEDCQVRNGCYVRENVIVGNRVVMGNSCEFKNCILFNDTQVPHFNYVGDSILGHRVEIGCNSVLSPGSLVGRNTIIYAGTQWRGVAPANSIVKIRQTHDVLPRRDAL